MVAMLLLGRTFCSVCAWCWLPASAIVCPCENEALAVVDLPALALASPWPCLGRHRRVLSRGSSAVPA
eukprot:14042714-Alexandrium_andersonii.AAC.1